mmetsp:Transcript_6706/g.17636  ORF Transcript_6706/g.17636 Transcript_6706/m.17636 type:complete len:82 (+) Transcript_6706:3-248(+)
MLEWFRSRLLSATQDFEVHTGASLCRGRRIKGFQLYRSSWHVSLDELAEQLASRHSRQANGMRPQGGSSERSNRAAVSDMR